MSHKRSSAYCTESCLQNTHIYRHIWIELIRLNAKWARNKGKKRCEWGRGGVRGRKISIYSRLLCVILIDTPIPFLYFVNACPSCSAIKPHFTSHEFVLYSMQCCCFAASHVKSTFFAFIKWNFIPINITSISFIPRREKLNERTQQRSDLFNSSNKMKII